MVTAMESCSIVGISCGEHGRLQTSASSNDDNKICECVCDEGWGTIQGGDVLMTTSESQEDTSTGIPLDTSWCSINVDQGGGGTGEYASPTIHSQTVGNSKSGVMTQLEVHYLQVSTQ